MSNIVDAGQLSLINSFTHTWTIENFTSHCEKLDPLIRIMSPRFVINSEIKMAIYLIIFNESEDQPSKKDFLAVFPKLFISLDNAVTTDYEFCMLNSENEKVLSKFHNHYYHTFTNNPNTLTGLGMWLINKNDVTNPEYKLLKDDKFTILCKMNIVNDKINEPHLSFKNCSEVEKLFDEENFEDTTLIVNGKELKIHKAILSAKSPVFYAMFYNNSKEANEDLIIINDFSYEVFEDLVKFVYTGNIENFENHVNKLFAAADKYCIEELKVLCCRHFATNLNIENAIELMVLSTIYDTGKLKDMIQNFIAENIVQIVKTSGFEEAKKSHPDVVIELMKTSILKK